MAKRPGVVVEDEDGSFKMVYPDVRSRYSKFSRVTLDCSKDKGRTHSEFQDECDLNRIMAKYRTTGVLPPGRSLGTFGDFSEVGDFLEAQAIIAAAEEQFGALPSDVRRRFDNSPAKMLAFVADRGNLEEARKLGMLKDEPKIEPPGAPVPPPVVPAVPPTDK